MFSLLLGGQKLAELSVEKEFCNCSDIDRVSIHLCLNWHCHFYFWAFPLFWVLCKWRMHSSKSENENEAFEDAKNGVWASLGWTCVKEFLSSAGKSQYCIRPPNILKGNIFQNKWGKVHSIPSLQKWILQLSWHGWKDLSENLEAVEINLMEIFPY